MVEHPQEARLDDIFLALADPTRRAIVDRLASGEEPTLSALAAPFEISLPAVAKHVRILVRAGLVADSRVGRERRCRLVGEPLATADEWLVRHRVFWQDQLGSLKEYMERRRRESR